MLLASIKIPYVYKAIYLGEIFDPKVEVTLCGPHRKSTRVAFLIDSGADVTMMPAGIAQVLEIVLAAEPEVKVQGISGIETACYSAEIEIQIEAWSARIPCLFSSDPRSPFLLGRAGFFEQACITFDSTNDELIPVPTTDH